MRSVLFRNGTRKYAQASRDLTAEIYHVADNAIMFATFNYLELGQLYATFGFTQVTVEMLNSILNVFRRRFNNNENDST